MQHHGLRHGDGGRACARRRGGLCACAQSGRGEGLGQHGLPGLRRGRLLLHQRHQEAHGRQAVELDALLLQRVDGVLDLLLAARELAFHGAGGNAEGVGDLARGHLLVVIHGDRRTLSVGELAKDLVDELRGLLAL